MALISWHAKTALQEVAQSYLKPASVVLDVGCGIRPQRLLGAFLHILIEPYQAYIDVVRAQLPDAPNHIILRGTWDQVLPLFPDQSVDTVIAGDFIEHLDKPAGWRFLDEAQRVSRQQLCLFTPLGYMKQTYELGKPDRWGLQGGYWQQHKSGWTPDEFGDGWSCLCCEHYHDVDEDEQPLDPAHGAFYAIYSR